MRLKDFDSWLIHEMSRSGGDILRVALGVVYLWFGLLKIIDHSPAKDFIHTVYPFVPIQEFLLVLGIWEVAIGVGLLLKKCLRLTLGLLWLQMAGVFFAIIIAPSQIFVGSPFFLTMEGEFIVKNIVFIGASLVIGGQAFVRKYSRR